MREIRLLLLDGDAAFNMAFDEAMLLLRALGKIPNTLRLYVFKPSAVTIGYFQSVSESVNVDYVRSKNIDVVRRPTGGGSVYHDEHGEITYSVVMAEDDVPKDPVESFRYLSMGVVQAARSLGAPAKFVPLNDIVIEGKKFSGQAQVRRFNAVLQHGTFMYATNIDVLASCLVGSKIKLKEKGITTIKERVTTISIYTGREVSKDEAINSLIKGFENSFNVKLIEEKPSAYEIHLAESIKWKYLSAGWNYMRP